MGDNSGVFFEKFWYGCAGWERLSVEFEFVIVGIIVSWSTSF